jgi:hypothetical protein
MPSGQAYLMPALDLNVNSAHENAVPASQLKKCFLLAPEMPLALIRRRHVVIAVAARIGKFSEVVLSSLATSKI